MYGLDTNQSFEFLEQALLLQLGVGENELVFNFDGDIVLIVESDLCIRDPRSNQRFIRSIEAARVAVDFVGLRVTAARALPGGTLKIDFGPDKSIEIYDTSSHFESYSVTWPKGSIIV